MNKYVEALKDVAVINYEVNQIPGVYAVIAGGAPRDIDFKKPFKDIDIFVVTDTEDDEKLRAVELKYSEFFDFISIHDPDNPYEENLNEIAHVENHEFTRYDTRFDVQIIFQKSLNTGNPLKEITDSFDLGCSQIAFKYADGAHKFIKSEQYKQDKAGGKVRLTPFGLNLPTQERRAKTRRRGERIARKLEQTWFPMWPADVALREEQLRQYNQMLDMQQAVLAERQAQAARRLIPNVGGNNQAIYYHGYNQAPIMGGWRNF